MPDQPRSRTDSDVRWQNFTKSMDSLFLPSTLAFLCFLVIVQFCTSIPTVRHGVDEVAGRFARVQSASTSVREPQTVTLFVSPDLEQTSFSVLVNGIPKGLLGGSAIRLNVSSGDRIQLKANRTHGEILVTIHYDSPLIQTPESGKTFDFPAGQSELVLPKIVFFGIG